MSETITVDGHEMNVDEYIRHEIDKFERLVVGRKLEPEEVASETAIAASMFAQRVAESMEEYDENEKIKFVVKEDDKEPETIELRNDNALYRIGLLVPNLRGRNVEGVETFYNVTARKIQKLLKELEGSSLYYVVDMH
tara:strand:+ start:383 stop:796 length:414 start_codon:yes stop_codon:yes gene_type:complete